VFTASGSSQGLGSLVPIAFVAITGLVVFWRTAIKILAIALILLVVLGLSELVHRALFKTFALERVSD
jgi:hypothetical protein